MLPKLPFRSIRDSSGRRTLVGLTPAETDQLIRLAALEDGKDAWTKLYAKHESAYRYLCIELQVEPLEGSF